MLDDEERMVNRYVSIGERDAHPFDVLGSPHQKLYNFLCPHHRKNYSCMDPRHEGGGSRGVPFLSFDFVGEKSSFRSRITGRIDVRICLYLFDRTYFLLSLWRAYVTSDGDVSRALDA